MANVVDVLEHWLEVYSSDPVDVGYEDHIFFFGYRRPRRIVITTCLSALTLGVLEGREVGTLGTRVHRMVYFDSKEQLRYRERPPSYDWNSERISRCVSVSVRTAAFFAHGWSLSTVYVFGDPLFAGLESIVGLRTKRLLVVDSSTKKTLSATTIQGPAEELEENWKELSAGIRRDAAKALKIQARRVELVATSARGPASLLKVDLKSRRVRKLNRPNFGQSLAGKRLI